MYIAFTNKSSNSLRALSYFISGLVGLFVLLNFHMYSLLSVLITLMIFSCVVLFRDKIAKFVVEVNQTIKVNIISLIIINILTSVFAGLLGAAKWPKFDVILTETNSFNLIFSKYIATVLVLGLVMSAVISAGFNMLKNGEAE